MITKELSNCRQLSHFSLINSLYMYIDTTDDFQADTLFVNNGIKGIKFLEEFKKPDCKYSIIVCKVPKKHTEKFIKCMDELESKMLLIGHHDYLLFCEQLFDDIEKSNKEMV